MPSPLVRLVSRLGTSVVCSIGGSDAPEIHPSPYPNSLTRVHALTTYTGTATCSPLTFARARTSCTTGAPRRQPRRRVQVDKPPTRPCIRPPSRIAASPNVHLHVIYNVGRYGGKYGKYDAHTAKIR
eukprot:482438-Pyramimonas_sp.AAC.2